MLRLIVGYGSVCIRHVDIADADASRVTRGRLHPVLVGILRLLLRGTVPSRVRLRLVRQHLVSRLGRLRILHSLERPRRGKRLVCLLLLLVARMQVLQTHPHPVHGRMHGHLYGRFVLRHGADAVLGAVGGDSVRARRADPERDHPYGAAEGHAAEDVALAGLVGGAVEVQVALDDLALAAGIVDGGRGHTDPDGGDAARQGEREPGHGR